MNYLHQRQQKFKDVASAANLFRVSEKLCILNNSYTQGIIHNDLFPQILAIFNKLQVFWVGLVYILILFVFISG
jgi:hypothetical protein